MSFGSRVIRLRRESRVNSESEVAGRFLLQVAPGFVETRTSPESSLETV